MKIKILMVLTILFPVSAWALDSSCSSSTDFSKFMIKGSEKSPYASEKLYNFNKIRSELKESLLTDKFEEKKADCLSQFYEQAMNDSATYWADRSSKEGCLAEGEVPPVKPEACSEKTWNEFQKSRAYLNSLDREWKGQLKTLVAEAEKKPKTEVCENCETKTTQPSSLAKVAASSAAVQQRLCCGTDKEKAGIVRAVYPDISFNSCVDKTTEQDKSVVSAGGLASCAGNMIVAAIKTFWENIKFLASLPFEMAGAYSALKEMWANETLRSKMVDQIQISIGDFIGYRVDSLKGCLNNYEQSQLMCEMTGQVIGSIADVGVLFKIFKLAKGGKLTENLADLIGQSEKGKALLAKLDKTKQMAGQGLKAATEMKTATVNAVKSAAIQSADAAKFASKMLTSTKTFDALFNKQAKKVAVKGEVSEVKQIVGESKVADIPQPKQMETMSLNEPRVLEIAENSRISFKAFNGSYVNADVVIAHGDTVYVNYFNPKTGNKMHGQIDLAEVRPRLAIGEEIHVPVGDGRYANAKIKDWSDAEVQVTWTENGKEIKRTVSMDDVKNPAKVTESSTLKEVLDFEKRFDEMAKDKGNLSKSRSLFRGKTQEAILNESQKLKDDIYSLIWRGIMDEKKGDTILDQIRVATREATKPTLLERTTEKIAEKVNLKGNFQPIKDVEVFDEGSIVKTYNNEVKNLNSLNVGFKATEIPTEMCNYLDGLYGVKVEVKRVSGGTGDVFTGKILEVTDLPTPLSKGSVGTKAFLHPEISAYKAKLDKMGYKLVVDTTIEDINAGAYAHYHKKVLALRANSSWQEFVHEFQHVEFGHFIKSNFGSMRVHVSEGKNLLKELSPELIQQIGVKRVERIQQLLKRGLPSNAVNETLSVDAELRALGFKKFIPGNATRASRYALRHQITDLEKVSQSLSPKQKVELSTAKIKHQLLVAYEFAPIVTVGTLDVAAIAYYYDSWSGLIFAKKKHSQTLTPFYLEDK